MKKEINLNQNMLATWSCISGVISICIVMALFMIAIPMMVFLGLAMAFEPLSEITLIMRTVMISFGIIGLALGIASIKKSGRSKRAVIGNILGIVNITIPILLLIESFFS